MYCPGCEVVQENMRGETCEVCGEVLLDKRPPAPPSRPMTAKAETGARYPAAETLITIFRVLGYITITVGILIAATGVMTQSGAGLVFSAATIAYTLGLFIIFLAAAEGIKILIDIEANTRASVEFFQKKLEE